jgi:hypothetical protein
MLHSQARDRLIFRIKICPRNGANFRSSIFSKSVARMQRGAGKQLLWPIVFFQQMASQL